MSLKLYDIDDQFSSAVMRRNRFHHHTEGVTKKSGNNISYSRLLLNGQPETFDDGNSYENILQRINGSTKEITKYPTIKKPDSPSCSRTPSSKKTKKLSTPKNPSKQRKSMFVNTKEVGKNTLNIINEEKDELSKSLNTTVLPNTTNIIRNSLINNIFNSNGENGKSKDKKTIRNWDCELQKEKQLNQIEIIQKRLMNYTLVETNTNFAINAISKNLIISNTPADSSTSIKIPLPKKRYFLCCVST